jgi:tRNA threonylcarbamoyladenosine biosynthesis protein TsaB
VVRRCGIEWGQTARIHGRSATCCICVVPLHSPTLLAIDTAADSCSVALLRHGSLTEQIEQVGHRHSERVLPMVHALLDAAGIGLVACDAIAFGAGPGAFTGLRIACGIAQGLAFGARLKVIPVGNLKALAFSVLAYRRNATVLCAVDARMREAYCAVYADGTDGLIEVLAPATVPAAELATLVERYRPDVLVGDAGAAFAMELAAVRSRVEVDDRRVSAASIAKCAACRWPDGIIEAAAAAPLYVRDRVALTIEERRCAAGAGA